MHDESHGHKFAIVELPILRFSCSPGQDSNGEHLGGNHFRLHRGRIECLPQHVERHQVPEPVAGNGTEVVSISLELHLQIADIG